MDCIHKELQELVALGHRKVILAPWVVSCIGTLFNFTLICILVVSWISIIFEYAVLMDRKNNACHSDNLVFTRLRRLA
ncbi:uncharacterized protein [Triticum aestivum]|uniref:uncharacterized protein isoform X2 n=1 Tax=Triticum aestivum TaxID=4565 RepID=UPI001D027AF4|nr:uncharacterized protein LOC123160712 isoform X2 [Triticum aestivum]